jgi:transcriptional regulator with GAF, ATPase, and Fis domain
MERSFETSRDRGDRVRANGASLRDHLFVLLECNRPLSGATRYALSDVDEVLIGRGNAREARRVNIHGVRRLSLTIPDRLISGAHARILRAESGWVVEDLHSTNGVLCDGHPVTRAELTDRTIVECGRTLFAIGRDLVTPDETPDDVDFADAAAIGGLATVMPSVAREFNSIRRAAGSTAPVLLLAETGTGKELTARAVHECSGRKGEFVAVNCGALTSSLAEGLLFGHVRGAFSGALKDERGLVRAAAGGTLFLDEIGDLPAASQPALLRVLQQKEVMPIGSPRAIEVDVRIVAATHRSLPQLAARGDFRHDLLARLDGFTFRLLPMRERIFDLALFLRTILQRQGDPRTARLRIAPEAARALYKHVWPSNVREFEQCILRALTFSNDEMIGIEHISFGVLSSDPCAELPAREAKDEPPRGVDDLVALLRAHGGNIAAVARGTGKAATQVRRWMKRFGIDPNDYRN